MSTDLIRPIIVFNNVDLTVNQVSAGIHVQYSDNVGIQFVWTGAPVGTFGIDVSNDAILTPQGTVTGGTWTPLVLTSPQPPVATGAPGNGYIDVTQVSASFVRATYTATSGSGSCTATLTAKAV